MITGVRQAITRMSLDMQLPDVQKSFSCTKGDVNRRLEITLTDGGRPFELPNKWTVILSGRKPDETTLNNGCVVERGKIIYDFASGAEIATCPGVFQINFQIYDETGLPVATPAIWVQVTEGSRDAASNDQFTALEDLIRKINEAKEGIKTLEDLMNAGGPLAATVGAVIIEAAEWKDGEAVITLPGTGKNTTTLLIPADEKTRLAATESALYVNADRIDEEKETIVLAKAAASDAVEMSFVYVIVRGRGVESGEQESETPPAVSLVGVGGGAASDSLIYVGDGTMPEDCIMQIIPDEDDTILGESGDEPEPDEPDDPENDGTYTVTMNLTNVTARNTANTVEAGARYECELYAPDGYEITTLSVKMGGVDVPGASMVQGDEAHVTIEEVTGNIVIKAIATANESSGGGADTENVTVTIAKDEHVTVLMNGEKVSYITAKQGDSIYLEIQLETGYTFAPGTPQVMTASGTDITSETYNSGMQSITLMNMYESVTIAISTTPIVAE